MKVCKTCEATITNTKTYCDTCAEARRQMNIKKQTRERKAKALAAQIAAKNKVPLASWMTTRGAISDTSMRSNFG